MGSFRTRLTLLHVGIVIGVLLVAALMGRWSLTEQIYAQLDAALLALAETEAATLASVPEQPIRVHEVDASPAPPSLVRLDRLVQIVDAHGQVLARSRNLEQASLPAPSTPPTAGREQYETLPHFGEEPLRMVSLAVPVGSHVYTVQVAGSLDDAQHVVQSTSLLFLVLAIVLSAAIAVSGSLLTRRVFRAIEAIVDKTRDIHQDNLGERLPRLSERDEIAALVDTLNDLLARLEHGFLSQQQFTADASHELRSPLSRLRAELEVTLRRPRPVAEYQEALRSSLAEVERLTELVDELLMLARLDAGHEFASGIPERAATCVLEVIERLRPFAEARQIHFAIEEMADVSVLIPCSHLGRIVSNLLDNACKFSPPGSIVRVALRLEGSKAVFAVADSGPGLDPTEQLHVFERFFRGAKARAQDISGSGLGLALCKAIVTVHGGTIEAGNVPGGGAQFTVSFSASPSGTH